MSYPSNFTTIQPSYGASVGDTIIYNFIANRDYPPQIYSCVWKAKSLSPSNECPKPGIEAEFFALLMQTARINYRVTMIDRKRSARRTTQAIAPSATFDWGRRVNGTWTNVYSWIMEQYNDTQTAVTFFSMSGDRVEDFEFMYPVRCGEYI